MPSYKDLVKATGLSLGTISNVIQNKGNVRPENRKMVLNAIRELGYRVDYQARSLAYQLRGPGGLLHAVHPLQGGVGIREGIHRCGHALWTKSQRSRSRS